MNGTDFTKSDQELLQEFLAATADDPNIGNGASEGKARRKEIKSFMRWVRLDRKCEQEGHRWMESSASAEDGYSHLECKRCGTSHDIFW